jgi:hypothetical protein
MGAVEAMLLEPQAQQATKARGKAAASDSAAPEAAGNELLLWMLAGDRHCEAEGRRALGLSLAEAKAVRDTHAVRFERVRQLRCLGALLTRDELAVLFRARLAELLLRSDSASDLAALLRVFDKVPQRADLLESSPSEGHSIQYQPDGNDLSSLDLAECIAEAQRLLAQIEEEAGGEVTEDRLQVAAKTRSVCNQKPETCNLDGDADE